VDLRLEKFEAGEDGFLFHSGVGAEGLSLRVKG
jgi:hypothetical protein